MNDVHLQRWERLIATCIDAGSGTLWQVREDLWKNYLHIPYYRSNRTWHPGLSIMRGTPKGLYEFIPMLHGTSGKKGPVTVRGITYEKGEDYSTSFGQIVSPAPLPASRLVPSGPAHEELSKSNPLRTRGISQNTHKPRITDTEMQRLDAWLRERGLA